MIFRHLPDKGKPITEWEHESRGWQNVVEGIRRTIIKLQSHKASSRKSREKLQAELAFQYGNVQTLLGQKDMAIEAYSNAIHLNPRDARAYNNRGVDYGEKGEGDLAIKDFDKAIDLKPDYDLAYNNRGAVYRRKGEHDLAIKDCNKAIRLKPDYAEPYSNRGAAYRNKGDYDRAIKDYGRAIKLKTKFCSSILQIAVLRTMKKENWISAIKDYGKAIALNPKLAHPYNNRGNVYLRKGNFDSAIEDYSKAIELNPGLGLAYYNRAEAWLHLKEWDKAKADLTDRLSQLGVDIIAAFHNAYKNVETFEKRRGFKVRDDVALMLTQRRRNRYPKKLKILDAEGKPLESPNVVNLRAQLRNTGMPLGTVPQGKTFFRHQDLTH